ncbi:glycoside hydrolase family 3 C-terminal domain-containing protein [Qipengyuania qiaonensis]|uniref:Glycoside hydrolase family 3 C-terminal domain-containing protein n=1 Tax=Qipengyuania qiaonensis TaxID=2867240 RepID=A0ABS7J7V0_9SPHN|nr:glycoside hydrolase family 3 C-terminal domain-containing protein [Qipengyuania qiaonensis]MBX7483400.1 glycoside hydrolase family 3 C-terminal domain-containing protein [Qipengyuania qiaonensis]
MALRPTQNAAERERFVEDLLDIMSTEEKIGQLVLRPVPAQGDTSDTRYLRDQLKRGQLCGLVGSGSQVELAKFRRIAIEETRLGIPLLIADELGRGDTVVMPSPFALSASWAPDIVENATRIIAGEARDAGKNWLLGPDVSLSSWPTEADISSTWSASELLARSLASASVRGIQHDDGSDEGSLACLRVDDASWTNRRMPHTIAEKFRLVAGVLRESQPASVALDPVTQDAFDIGGDADGPAFSIGGPGGYEGIDLAEWGEVARGAGQDSRRAPYVGLSVGAVMAALNEGRITALQIDDAVRRVLGAKYDLGLFRADGPDERPSRSQTPRDARTVALDAALHSIVLLRNEPALLPLSVDSGAILVVGLAATDRSLPTAQANRDGASLIDGLDALGLRHKYVPGLALREERDQSQSGRLVNADRMAIGMASEAARRSRTVIVVLGETDELGEAQQTLLEALRVANGNVVLVTLGSRPLDPDIGGEKLPCVLHAGQLGTTSGHAIAQVLAGKFAPCGRLSIGLIDKGRTGLSLGHGLGFSEFALEDHSAELGHDRVVVSTVLHNVGDREGLETVQLYLKRPAGRGYGRSELSDFQRVSLLAGESRRLLFEIGGNQLGRFERNGKFVIDPGSYMVAVGLSEGQAHAAEISIPPALAQAMGKARSIDPFPALFGRMRNSA